MPCRVCVSPSRQVQRTVTNESVAINPSLDRSSPSPAPLGHTTKDIGSNAIVRKEVTETSAEECARINKAWDIVWDSWSKELFPPTTFASDDERTYVQPMVSGKTYTASDGIPRLAADYTSIGTTTITISQHVTMTDLMEPSTTFSEPPPRCTVDDGPDCNRLWNSFFSTVEGARQMFTGNYFYGPRSLGPRPCNPPSWQPQCLMWADQAALLHWPSTQTRDLDVAIDLAVRDSGGSLVVTTDALTLLSKRAAAGFRGFGPEDRDKWYVIPSVSCSDTSRQQ